MASTQVNGHGLAVAEQHVQAAFYDQWLQLKDSVLADKHPRIKLPAAVRQRLQPTAEPPCTSSQSSASQLPGLSNGSNREQAMRSSSYGAAAARLGNAQAFSQNTSTATGTNATKSGIDPILLTKSEDLIRAEMQLKRQRIERQLKDAADQRKHNVHFRNTEEAPPLVNLTETFSKALEMVKPVSGLKPPANAQTAASDSFDENSYYSSQANDWSSEEGSSKNKKADATHSASNASVFKKHPVEIEPLDKQPHPSSQAFAQHENEALYDAEREDSEEYSPPDANAFSGPDGDAGAMDLDDGKCPLFVLDTTQLSNGEDSSEFVPQDAYVPSPQAPVTTNHLTQLAAPQPARVSPLTMVNPPGLGQSQTSYPSASSNQHPASSHAYQSSSAYRQQFESDDSTTSPRTSTQTSPNGAFKKQRGKGNKKRKRDTETHSTKARKTCSKPAAPSPEPYIKPEPVSPPPFAAPPALQPVHTRPYQLPPDVEIVPGPRQSYYQEPPPPPSHYGLDGVSSPNVIRVSSPGVYGRPRRDDQDLRRVASLHAAHRPVSPMARISSPAGYRTVSQPFPERTSRYGEEIMRAPQMQYLRSERSVTPPHLRAAREAPMSLMAPPPPPPTRRIVVDQYGNRYYANEPEAPSRMSVAPQSRPEPEMTYERAPSRQSVVYASQPTHNVYEDEHGMRMPPPPPPIRRVVEQPEAVPTDYRAYRQREYSRAPEPQYYRDEAGGPVYIREGPGPRGSVYPPEAAPAGPYAPRAYSVRPEVEHVRYMSRQPSMAPQSEFVRMGETGGRAATMAPPPAPMRAVSVVPGSEYGRPVDMRYGYGAGQAAGPYAGGSGVRYGEEGSAAPREIYVDQYGREVRRVGY